MGFTVIDEVLAMTSTVPEAAVVLLVTLTAAVALAVVVVAVAVLLLLPSIKAARVAARESPDSRFWTT